MTTMTPIRMTLLAGAAAPLLALQLRQPSLAVRLLSFPLVGAHGGGRLPTGRRPGIAPCEPDATAGYEVIAGSAWLPCGTRGPDRPEVRRHLRGRRRPHPGRRRARRPSPAARGTTWSSWCRPWARRPTTSSPWPTPCRPPSPAGRWTCSSPSASARAWRCCAWPSPTSGVDAVSLHRQPGRHHHRHRPQQGQDPRGARATGSATRSADGQGLRGRRLPGRVDRARRSPSSAGAAPTPPPSPWPPPSRPTAARSTPTSPACSPPTPASCRRPAS